MMTLSGQVVTLTEGAPTLEDIAVGLSREWRFANQQLFYWSVAHHSLVVQEILAALGEGPIIQLDALLHDAPESCMRDVPTTFKTWDRKNAEFALLQRIYDSLNLSFPSLRERSTVSEADRLALVAEAHMVTPTATYERIVTEVGGVPENLTTNVIVHGIYGAYETEAEVRFEWLARVREFIADRHQTKEKFVYAVRQIPEEEG